MQFLEKLCQYPSIFIFHNGFDQSFDDEDLNAWELEAKRWARVLLFVGRENLAPILKVRVTLHLWRQFYFWWCIL